MKWRVCIVQFLYCTAGEGTFRVRGLRHFWGGRKYTEAPTQPTQIINSGEIQGESESPAVEEKGQVKWTKDKVLAE